MKEAVARELRLSLENEAMQGEGMIRGSSMQIVQYRLDRTASTADPDTRFITEDGRNWRLVEDWA